ncbi:hypothetical protein BGP_2413 [Beggiatoa sp. PS]|nr:hypothetical protein BGP_2413 [Beggiatoa sp. PS]
MTHKIPITNYPLPITHSPCLRRSYDNTPHIFRIINATDDSQLGF